MPCSWKWVNDSLACWQSVIILTPGPKVDLREGIWAAGVALHVASQKVLTLGTHKQSNVIIIFAPEEFSGVPRGSNQRDSHSEDLVLQGISMRAQYLKHEARASPLLAEFIQLPIHLQPAFSQVLATVSQDLDDLSHLYLHFVTSKLMLGKEMRKSLTKLRLEIPH